MHTCLISLRQFGVFDVLSEENDVSFCHFNYHFLMLAFLFFFASSTVSLCFSRFSLSLVSFRFLHIFFRTKFLQRGVACVSEWVSEWMGRTREHTYTMCYFPISKFSCSNHRQGLNLRRALSPGLSLSLSQMGSIGKRTAQLYRVMEGHDRQHVCLISRGSSSMHLLRLYLRERAKNNISCHQSACAELSVNMTEYFSRKSVGSG